MTRFSERKKQRQAYISCAVGLFFLFVNMPEKAHSFEKPAALQTVNVFAAASLRDVVEEFSKAFTSQSCTMLGVYASSSALARQVLSGAPADVFISANTLWIDEIEKAGLVAKDKRFVLAANSLVLIAPQGTPLTVLKTPSDLPAFLANKKIAIGEPTTVPAGIYARQAFASLGVFDALQPSFVFTQNVRAVLAWVERGEALGVVYKTDAAISQKTKIIYKFSKSTHDPIHYAAALLSKNTPCAAAFFNFLKTQTAQNILTDYGFTPIPTASKNQTKEN